MLDRAAMVRAFDAAEKAFGTVTILVNNAGVTHADRVAEMPEETWRRVLGTNLDAVLYWAQEAARRMIAAKKQGAIVNIASILGFGVVEGRRRLCGRQGRRGAAHPRARARACLQGRARERHRAGLRRDRDQRGVSCRQGRRDDAHIPVGRFGETRDLDGALLLLASDAGRFMAGSTIVVDGGQMLAFPGV